MVRKNQNISQEQLQSIRAMSDFDLRMLLSEVHDHGWPRASRIIPLIERSRKENICGND